MTSQYRIALHLLRHYINCIEVRTDLSNGTWWKLTPGIYADLCDENPPYVVKECNFRLDNSDEMEETMINGRECSNAVELNCVGAFDLFGITELLKEAQG